MAAILQEGNRPALRGKSYQEIAFAHLSPFTNGEIPTDTFRAR